MPPDKAKELVSFRENCEEKGSVSPIYISIGFGDRAIGYSAQLLS
jgi:hypothetical protein